MVNNLYIIIFTWTHDINGIKEQIPVSMKI